MHVCISQTMSGAVLYVNYQSVTRYYQWKKNYYWGEEREKMEKFGKNGR